MYLKRQSYKYCRINSAKTIFKKMKCFKYTFMVMPLILSSVWFADSAERGEGDGICEHSSDLETASTTDKSFIQETLAQTNTRRQAQEWPPLEINNELCKFSQYWVNLLAEQNAIFHTGKRCGENLFMQKEGSYTAERVVKAWYKEELQDKTVNVSTSSSPNDDFKNSFWKKMKGMCVGVARGKTDYSVEGPIFVVAHYTDKQNTTVNTTVNLTISTTTRVPEEIRETEGEVAHLGRDPDGKVNQDQIDKNDDSKSRAALNFQNTIWIWSIVGFGWCLLC